MASLAGELLAGALRQTGDGEKVRGISALHSLLVKSRNRLLELPRIYKRVILAALDFVLLSFALWLSISLRYSTIYLPPSWEAAVLFAAAPVIGVATFAFCRLYKHVTRYLGYRAHSHIVGCVWLSVLIWSLFVFMGGQYGMPRSAIFGYGILATLLVMGSREVAAKLLQSAGVRMAPLSAGAEPRPIIIYGAGKLGVQLFDALRQTTDHHAVAFVDSEPSLWRQYVAGLKVYPPSALGHLIERDDVKDVLLALPDSQRRERRRILKELELQHVTVKILPAVGDIASGRVSVSDLRPLQVDDLLGREKVPPNFELMARTTRGKSILVTGAAGSVGSELVHQILHQDPRRIVLFDISEVTLYEIEREVSEIVQTFPESLQRPEVVAVLGTVLDASQVRDTIARYGIEIIYHAAAYKHVPIVEHNPIFGLRNNTFGAAVMAECAKAEGVELMVLISTDKAVRPTNIMGASKRLAELVLQAAALDAGGTVFTMVRFGNVLDSSGSVVKTFRRQIRNGGPVTVTHPEIIRYFMSIPEAAELVIQAGAMAKGGEVFVLDMGEPVRIDDLARLMVRLMGLEVKCEENPDGEITITYTGLRPGEKLFEELLVGANTSKTEHARIGQSDEPFLSRAELDRELELLEAAMRRRNMASIQAVLMRTVEGYRAKVHEAEGEEEPLLTVCAPDARTLH